jgi:hypothetical protein
MGEKKAVGYCGVRRFILGGDLDSVWWDDAAGNLPWWGSLPYVTVNNYNLTGGDAALSHHSELLDP